MYFLFLHSLITLVLASNQIQSIDITSGGGAFQAMDISENGSKLVVGLTNDTLMIYEWIGGQYQVAQQIGIASGFTNSIEITQNQQIILCSQTQNFYVYRYNPTSSQYEVFHSELGLFFSKDAKITDDQNLIFETNAFTSTVYKYNTNLYFYDHYLSTSESIDYDVIDCNSDGKYVVYGQETTGNVNFYEFNGGQYLLIDSFVTNISIKTIHLYQDRSKMLVGGDSSVFVYQYSIITTSFEFKQSISLGGPIQDIFVADSTIIFCADQLYFFIEDQTTGMLISQSNLTIPYAPTLESVRADGSLLIIGDFLDLFIYSYDISSNNTTNGTNTTNTTNATNATNTTNTTNATNATNTTNTTNTTNATNTTNTTNTTNATNATNTTNGTNGTNTTNATNAANTTNAANGTNATNAANTTNTTTNQDNATNTTTNQSNVTQFLREGCFTYNIQNQTCLEFCDQSCLFCSGTLSNCTECSKYYNKQGDNTCKLSNEILWIKIAYGLASIWRNRKTKELLFLLDDIWLYEYHKPEYKGFVSDIFEVGRLIEETKDEIIDLDQFQPVQNFTRHMKKYDSFANQKYLTLQRKNDSLPLNLIDYVIQVIPLTVLIFLVNVFLFWILRDYSCSIYFRSTSFFGYLFVSLIEGNIQNFIFLGLRNLTYLFARDFTDKLFNLLIVLLFFVVIFFTFAGYFLLHYFYKKLFKYFLDNLFRVQGSSWMMCVVYCLRPFLKGCIHSLMYEHNDAQLILLGLVDLFTFGVIVNQQINNNNYKSQICFSCLASYIGSGVVLNGLLMANVKYHHIPEMMEIIDSGFLILMIFRITVLVLACIFNFTELYKYRPDILDEIDDNSPADFRIYENGVEIKNEGEKHNEKGVKIEKFKKIQEKRNKGKKEEGEEKGNEKRNKESKNKREKNYKREQEERSNEKRNKESKNKREKNYKREQEERKKQLAPSKTQQQLNVKRPKMQQYS